MSDKETKLTLDLYLALKGMVESYDLTVQHFPQRHIVRGVVSGYFLGEIERARQLVKQFEEDNKVKIR